MRQNQSVSLRGKFHRILNPILLQKGWDITVSLVVVLAVLLINLIWWQGQPIISNSEDRWTLVNAQLSLDKYAQIWQPTAFGTQVPFALVYRPILMFLVMVNHSSDQAINVRMVVGLMMILGFMGMYFWSRQWFKFEVLTSWVIAAFYSLNLYAMFQIWQRFLYPGIFGWAYLPWFGLSLVNWMTSARWQWLIIWLGAAVLFAPTFGHPAYIIVFGTVGLILTLGVSWQGWNGQTARRLGRAMVAVLGWLTVGWWWIKLAVTFNGSYGSASFFDPQKNYLSLDAVSRHWGSIDILLLRQSFYTGPDSLFGFFYAQPWVIIVSWLILMVSVVGWWRVGHHRGWLIGLWVAGWWFSKGINKPLGETFYYWAMTHLPAFGSLRNPYEKFGLVLTLPLAIGFGVGLTWVSRRVGPKFGNWVVAGVMLVIVMMVWPFWTGALFPEANKMTIPANYLQAKAYLAAQTTGRAVVLPLLPGENVAYDWGFRGEEPAFFLFDNTMVSRPMFQQPDDTEYQLLSEAMWRPDFGLKLGQVGASYVVVHQDLVNFDLLPRLNQAIPSWQSMAKVAQFGELEIYQVDPNLVRPMIFSPTGVKLKIISMAADQYQLEVLDAKQPFQLVLLTKFHPGWQALIDGRKVGQHQVFEKWANSWQVEKTGNFMIQIQFEP